MIHRQIHLPIPCYDFFFLYDIRFEQFRMHSLANGILQRSHRMLQSVEATGGVYKG